MIVASTLFLAVVAVALAHTFPLAALAALSAGAALTPFVRRPARPAPHAPTGRAFRVVELGAAPAAARPSLPTCAPTAAPDPFPAAMRAAASAPNLARLLRPHGRPVAVQTLAAFDPAA